MKKLLILLLFVPLLAYSVSYKDQRGIIRMIYGGDTLMFKFVGDTNQFTGNLKHFAIDGALTIDSIRFKNSVSWFSSLLTPSGSLDLSLFGNNSILIEMNDTVGWNSLLYFINNKLYAPGIFINASSDTNKIINTSGTGKNLIQSAHENIFDADQNTFKSNGTTTAWHDANGIHSYVSATDTLILGEDTITDFTIRINNYIIDSNIVNRTELKDSIAALEARIGVTGECKLNANISKDGNLNAVMSTVTLTAYVNTEGVTYNWDGGSGTDKEYVVTVAGNYELIVSKAGCIDDTAYMFVPMANFDDDYNIVFDADRGITKVNDTVRYTGSFVIDGINIGAMRPLKAYGNVPNTYPAFLFDVYGNNLANMNRIILDSIGFEYESYPDTGSWTGNYLITKDWALSKIQENNSFSSLTVNDSSDIRTAMTTWHRNDSINTTTADAWIDIKLDTMIASVTTYGFTTPDSVNYISTTNGIFEINGYFNIAWGGVAEQCYLRTLKNGNEIKESKGLINQITGSNYDNLNINGRVNIVPGDTLKFQYYISAVDVDFDNSVTALIFDDIPVISINIKKVSK